jgi:hypothetical protein
MLPRAQGIIARRVLVNYWAEPRVVRPLVPAPFELDLRGGLAVVGICLIRLEELRLAGLPAAAGIAAEIMAHRIAVRFPAPGGMRPGVFIFRRDADSSLISAAGGRIFPGVHQLARFTVAEDENSIRIAVASPDGSADASVSVRPAVEWKATRLFASLCDVSRFFEAADCGFSCAVNGETLEGVRLSARDWAMLPLVPRQINSAFWDNTRFFPAGSIGLDSAVLMRNIAHEWLPAPELVTSARVGQAA